jgi:ParB-like chromosome segregation protein Spo0J
MLIRDRIKELRRVPAGLLRPNPRNWRTHPPAQRAALQAVLGDVGYAAALVARELDDGSLELIDGHLRAEVSPDSLVPVLVLDVSESEAAKLLATLDPLSAMAERDQELLDDLLSQVQTDDQSLRALLDSLAQSTVDLSNDDAADPKDVLVPDTFQVAVECADEDQQRELYERLTGEGLRCRLLTL